MNRPHSRTPPLLPAPAQYLPFEAGRYSVAPALKPLGWDYGNGAADGLAFQVDLHWPHYRSTKLAARAEMMERYNPRSLWGAEVERAAYQAIARRLVTEHPAWFILSDASSSGFTLSCELTGDQLQFSGEWDYLHTTPGDDGGPQYRSGLDALACQVQEDLAIITGTADAPGRLVAAHVCMPSHWRPAEKMDKDFIAIHQPVPGMETYFPAATALVQAVTARGPFVRFVWGFSSDDDLNHHPDRAAPPLDAAGKQWFVKIERQVLMPLPGAEAGLFLIRPSLISAADIFSHPQWRSALASGIRSMSEASLRYKGIEGVRDELLAALEEDEK